MNDSLLWSGVDRQVAATARKRGPAIVAHGGTVTRAAIALLSALAATSVVAAPAASPPASSMASAATPPVTTKSATPATRATARATDGVRYGQVDIDGVKIFYREAGNPAHPTLLLLHGFPASSFMYRDLIDRLADRFHLVAPDYPGFGYSDAPPPASYSYTFDRLADAMDKFTERLGLQRYALYMQDFGGPVGFRLASRHPEKVTFLVVQNANAYEEGLPDSFWAPAKTLWSDPSAANFAKIRDAAMSDEALAWNYTHGVRRPERINPDSWALQKSLLARPGNKEAMLALLYDYRTNLNQYAGWQTYFRKHQPPTLVVWGRNDVIFPPVGAHPYRRDLKKIEFHLLDTGHFALEDHADVIAGHIRRFATVVDRSR